MPVLDLSDIQFAGRAYVRLIAVMYVPGDAADDVELRQRIESSHHAKSFLEICRRMAKPVYSDDIPRVLMAADDADRATREMIDALVRRNGVFKGMNAGLILGDVLRRPGGTVEGAKKRILAEAKGKSGYSRNSLGRDWEEYRFGSPIWLTYRMLPGWGDLGADMSHELLIEILAHADAIRRMGEKHRTGDRGVPLLDPDKTWKFRLPDGFELPQIDLG